MDVSLRAGKNHDILVMPEKLILVGHNDDDCKLIKQIYDKISAGTIGELLQSSPGTSRQSEYKQAIADMDDMRRTHIEWAEHFETHPEIEAQYLASGNWDGAAKHREIVAQYDRAICLLAATQQGAAHRPKKRHSIRSLAANLVRRFLGG